MSVTQSSSATEVAAGTTIADVLRSNQLTSVFQPVVSLVSGDVTGYEALARGPVGALESPAALFAAARRSGVVSQLDEACRAAAFGAASQQRLCDPLTLFVNVEPAGLEDGSALVPPEAELDPALCVVLEITERSLFARPAELLRTVERVRDLGWGIALDDVGAESASLALMPLLRPDIVKLDLKLVQQRPSPAVAEIMHAVNAYAEESGAQVLAEGIETEGHLRAALALGATLGQGWFFGRPQPKATCDRGVVGLRLPRVRPAAGAVAGSPFGCLPTGTALREAPKKLLLEFSKHLEREAMRWGDASLLLSTFQHGRHYTRGTARRYAALARATGLVGALGAGLPEDLSPGVRTGLLAPDDPVVDEWDVVVLSPHFSAALLARDLGDDGPDSERRFEYALTYERATVVRAAHSLLSRVARA